MPVLNKHRLFSRLLRQEATEGGEGGGGATPPVEGQGAAGPAAPGTQPAWHDSIQDEGLKAFISGKGFKDASEAAQALQELEGKTAIPESPDAYQLPVPEGQDAAFATEAAKWMHEAGVPAAQAQVLAEKWNEYAATQQQAAEVERQQQSEADMNSLRKEWGSQYDANAELGRRAVRTFGIEEDSIEKISLALGDAETLRLFARIGKNLGEGTLTPDSSASQGGAEKSIEEVFYPSMTKK